MVHSTMRYRVDRAAADGEQLVRPLDQSAPAPLPAPPSAPASRSHTTSRRSTHATMPFARCLRGVTVLGLAVSGAALAQAPITLHGAVQFNDGHAFNRALEKFQELTVKYYGKPDQLRPAQEQRARPREGLLRVHEPGHLGRLRDRVARAHVDVLEGGAVHRRAVPVPRHRPLEQGARRRHAEADRRRSVGQGRRDADRLRRRRHAQHLRQQAGAQPGGDEGPQGPRAGRADLEQDLRRRSACRRR